MAKELHYFNFNAIAEPLRYLLYYTDQKFEDVRHDRKTWPDPEVKASLPYGQFPLYKEGDRVLTQSLAIAKYVAKGTELIPDDPWEQAAVENIVCTIYDYWYNVKAYILESDIERKFQLKSDVLDDKIDFYYSRFEKTLKENGGFFIGKLTWAEFILCGLTEASELFLGIELAKKYPSVAAVVETVTNLPRVKEYIAARGPYESPLSTTVYKGLEIAQGFK